MLDFVWSVGQPYKEVLGETLYAFPRPQPSEHQNRVYGDYSSTDIPTYLRTSPQTTKEFVLTEVWFSSMQGIFISFWISSRVALKNTWKPLSTDDSHIRNMVHLSISEFKKLSGIHFKLICSRFYY